MQRLSPETLSTLPDHVKRPGYDRSQLKAGIVHLGIGAFHRGHQAVVNDAAMASSGDLRWGIVGVSLRSPDTRDALQAQSGLYTVSVLDVDEEGAPAEHLQVVGGLLKVLVASEDITAVLEQIAHEDTRIVSLTVTEKGYNREPATGALRTGDAEIVHDLAHANAPRSALGVIVRSLDLRRQRGLPPVTLLSCDNLPSNGDTLRGLVLALAEQIDPALASWISAQCSFPNAMVDRIVPRTTDADRARISEALGVEDAWPVVGESFLEWVVEDHFVAGRPDWHLGGARFVESAEPFERLKLRFVNAPQSTLAYLGASSGIETNNKVIAHAPFRRFVDRMMREEIAPTLGTIPGVDLDGFRARLLARVANPALPHRTQQVAMDGTQKIPQRLLGTIADRLRANQPITCLSLAVAAWIHYLRGGDAGVTGYSINDPLAAELAQRIADGDRQAAELSNPADAERCRVAVFTAYTALFGDLGRAPRFIDAVARHTRTLRELGVDETVSSLMTEQE
ncbi:mannitol dehydrogenase family protein [Pigmentiphaga aceris]|uniref:Mannitol dehydrogenase family protein n=1 Tax=Pigmentiphaga aceris TaxID=1940612 RepID=A0A5C0B2Q7_9BURK|nr:mannitol dehydrogenase family protein [Pigmentiphaga aceris]QEI08842.1 mannitol dehydrogenase family protein [Pigmentiphaga aceris]